MSDVTLFGLPPSSFVRTAQMVLTAKGVEYTFEMADFRSDDYLKHHPFRRMPAFSHGDIALYEALAIATYVDEAFAGRALQPNTPMGRARMMQWISAINDYLYDSMVRQCVRERFVKPMRGLEPDEAMIAAAVPVIREHLGVFEAALRQGAYLCGAELSLADCFLAPPLFYFAATPEGKAMLPELPELSAWNARIAKTNAYAEINTLG